MSKEEYELKQQQKTAAKEKEGQKQKMKKNVKTALMILVIGGGVLGSGWFLANNIPTTSESEVISRQGIHWHSELNIKILGEEQEIPAGVGLGITERPIHTHDRDSLIHLEFAGLVREDDIRLGEFFKIWGKQFNKDCIFDKCSGSEGKLKMLVNGRENDEFENYIMRDGDKIEIIFE